MWGYVGTYYPPKYTWNKVSQTYMQLHCNDVDQMHYYTLDCMHSCNIEGLQDVATYCNMSPHVAIAVQVHCALNSHACTLHIYQLQGIQFQHTCGNACKTKPNLKLSNAGHLTLQIESSGSTGEDCKEISARENFKLSMVFELCWLQINGIPLFLLLS